MHFARISVTGYNPKLYKEQMSKDAFYTVMDNANAAIEYGADIGSYHLILDNNNVDYEASEYIGNWIRHVPGVKASIWKMHNWSGQLGVDWRIGKKKKKLWQTLFSRSNCQGRWYRRSAGRSCSLLYGSGSR